MWPLRKKHCSIELRPSQAKNPSPFQTKGQRSHVMWQRVQEIWGDSGGFSGLRYCSYEGHPGEGLAS